MSTEQSVGIAAAVPFLFHVTEHSASVNAFIPWYSSSALPQMV